MDLIGGFSETNMGYRYILVCVDQLTRYTEVIPLRTKTAFETADAFYRWWICRYGIPSTIITDSGLEFKNKFLASLCEQLGIAKVNIVCYHPQSNGIAERANQKLLDVLRITIGANEVNWDRGLSQSVWVINSCPHRILNISPFEALYGFIPASPFDLNVEFQEIPEPLRDTVQFAENRFSILRNRLEQMDVLLKRASGEKHVPKYELGDMVYIKKQVRKGLNYKLDQLFEGPFEITRILRAGRVIVKKGETFKTVSEDQIRK